MARPGPAEVLSSCPTEEELAAFAETPASVRDRLVRNHLVLCPTCQAWLEDATENSRVLPRVKCAVRDAAKIAGWSPEFTKTSDPFPIAAHPIPGYTIQDELHRGGQGVVYAAVQESTGQRVAIKVLKEGPFAGPADKARFEREVRILGQLKHPNIVAIHDRGEATGCFFIVMDLIDGRTLCAYLQDEEPSQRERLTLFARVCDAVRAAHLHGVIHRDLKSANIVVNNHGEPFVLDFGLAKRYGDDSEEMTITKSGQFMGSLPWASPEQVLGETTVLDLRSDVYSLGVVLYQMLTGDFPYDVTGSVHAVSDRILHLDPVRPSSKTSGLDDELDTVLLKCLAKEPDQRYQSAGELLADVQRYLNGEPIAAKGESTLYLLRKQLRRHRAALWGSAAFAAFFALAAAIIWSLYTQSEQRRIASVQNARKLLESNYTHGVGRAATVLADNHFGEATRFLENCPPSHRGWEWRYLRRLSDQSDRVLDGAIGELATLAISEQGDQLAAAGVRGVIKVWDTSAWSKVRTVQTGGGRIYALAFAKGGKWIISAGRSGSVQAWHVGSGRPVRTYRESVVPCILIAVSPDEERVAVGADDGVLTLHDVETGRELWTRSTSNRLSGGAAFSPNGEMLAVTSMVGRVLLFDVSSGKLIDRFTGGSEKMRALAYFPDGESFVTASQVGVVERWNLNNGAAQSFPDARPGGKGTVTVTANGSIVAALETNVLRVWHGRDTVPFVLGGHDGSVVALASHPSEDWFASASVDGTIRIWSPLPRVIPMILRGFGGQVHAVTFSPDGNTLASVGRAFDAMLWDAATGQPLRILSGHQRELTNVDISADGRRLATASADGTIKIRNLASQGPTLTIGTFTAPVLLAGFLPGGQHVAVGVADGTIGVWNIRAQAPLWQRTVDMGRATHMALSPDGTKIAYGGDERRVRVWNTEDGTLAFEPLHMDDRVRSLAFSHDGRRLAIGGERRIYLYGLERGQLLWAVKGHRNTINGIAFHPSGDRIASVSEDGTIVIRRALDGESLLTLRQNVAIHSIAFSLSGDQLAVGCVDKTVRVWDAGILSLDILDHRRQIDAVSRFVEQLYEKHVFAGDVLRALGRETKIDEETRTRAIALTTKRGDNAFELSEEAWYVAQFQDKSEKAYDSALRKASRASQLMPTNPALLNNLGAAQYRCQRFEGAVQSLTHANELRHGMEPQDAAFLAMALFQLGQVDEAKEYLARAKAAAQNHVEGWVPWRQSLLREAEELIDRSRTEPASRAN